MALNGVVVIPACHRPEFLALTLQNIDAAHNAPDDVRIFADHQAPLDDIEFVRDTYLPTAEIFQAHEHPTAPSGCWNILNALKAGYQTGADLVFLVEEDIAIRKHYFDWHRRMHANGEYAASCGRKDPRYYSLHPGLYTNPGSCLRADVLAKVVSHINDDYFAHLRGYLDEHFGQWDNQSPLDDGLIRRVIRQMGGVCKYPDEPTCAHRGFRLYDRLGIYKNKEKTIQKRIERLREIIRSVESTPDRDFIDFEEL